jgi:hypothetical protein
VNFGLSPFSVAAFSQYSATTRGLRSRPSKYCSSVAQTGDERRGSAAPDLVRQGEHVTFQQCGHAGPALIQDLCRYTLAFQEKLSTGVSYINAHIGDEQIDIQTII